MNISIFVSKLVNQLKEEKVFELILGDTEEGRKTWDEVARNRVGLIVKSVFQGLFPKENIRKAVNIEGEGSLIKPYNLFGSLGQYIRTFAF